LTRSREKGNARVGGLGHESDDGDLKRGRELGVRTRGEGSQKEHGNGAEDVRIRGQPCKRVVVEVEDEDHETMKIFKKGNALGKIGREQSRLRTRL